MDKQQLRKQMINLRKQQRIIDYEKNNELIIERVIAFLKLHNYQNVLIYMDMKMEVAITKLIGQGFNIYLTKTMPDLSLKVNEYNQADLVLHQFGYYESSSTNYLNPDIIDVAIIPGVAFDLSFNRLGYGKGYYDRFLANYPHIIRLAVAFDLQVIEELPTNEFDQRMDLIITETKILNNKKR